MGVDRLNTPGTFGKKGNLGEKKRDNGKAESGGKEERRQAQDKGKFQGTSLRRRPSHRVKIRQENQPKENRIVSGAGQGVKGQERFSTLQH